LKKKGYVQSASLKEKRGILLTQKGKRKALKTKLLLESSPGLKRRKDGKYSMVIFDIPEKKRRLRDEFRNILLSLGFRQFQKSVWISPFDIQKQLEEAIRIYDLEDYVRIFLIEEIEI
jgi:phenylacetic acid degradation operon negative regulatory protein